MMAIIISLAITIMALNSLEKIRYGNDSRKRV